VSEPVLLVDVTDGVARLTLNRPDAGNAVDLPLARALVAASIRCQTDASIRCVVLTGSGRLFCAGGDVAAMQAAGDGAGALLSELAGTFHMALARFARMPKPFVTLVNGPAAGGGFGLALSGDIVLAGGSAHFTPAYGLIGLVPDGGLSWLLPRLIGMKRAQEIILTNRRVKAQEAEAIGMVTRVVDDEALAAEGDAVARKLADGATRALGVTRAMLLDGASATYEAQLEAEVRGISAAGAGAEALEGVAALLAKRVPNFRGV
jgi:2-(1,2-epoxy-1,2-dihydrophenyl)acetyl-CoA isomerase